MQLNEIKEHIKPLSLTEKVQLIQDVAEMLKPSSADMLQQFEQAAARYEPSNQGPLEAYTSARQLQDFMKQVR